MGPLRIIPAVAIIALFTAACFLRGSVFQDSVTLYRDTAVKSPHKARPHNNLGDSLLRAGRFSEARPALIRAIGLQPDYPDALNNLATLYNREGRIDEAIRLLGDALSLDPGHIQARFNLAMTYYEAGMSTDAAVQYRMIIQLAPMSHEAAFSRRMLNTFIK